MLQVSQNTRAHEDNVPGNRSWKWASRGEEQFYSPVAEAVVVVESFELELGDVAAAPDTAAFVALDTLEIALVSPATVFAPAIAELGAVVALAEAGQLAADGNFTLTLCRIVVSDSISLHFIGAGKQICKNLRITQLDGDVKRFYTARSVYYQINVAFERRNLTGLVFGRALIFDTTRDTGNPSGVGAKSVQLDTLRKHRTAGLSFK